MKGYRDSLGRRYRRYRKRVDPLRVFRRTEFQARYRLSKKLVFLLSRKFTPNNSTKGKKNGGGLSPAQRVRIKYFNEPCYNSYYTFSRIPNIILILRNKCNITIFLLYKVAESVLIPFFFLLNYTLYK